MKRLRIGHEHVTVTELARRAGLSLQATSARLKRGWTVEQVMATPALRPGQRNAERRRMRTVSVSGHHGWVPNDTDEDIQERRALFAKAQAQDPEALATLRRMGLLTWQTAERGVIV